ncbi:ParB/RepB/Spo0J family partition protein [Nocardia sp. NPDC059195]|uniref:ParB/RepB/Spo0J family partition protein n=1 Tax=Nocardia sp. NPDC059195 TaxID=3346765 RepID=UPI0036C0E7AB
MARGGTRINLADLTEATGDHSPVDGKEAAQRRRATPPTSAPLADLVANPRNPRIDLGDLTELASIAEIQLQPALVITRAAYLQLYPEDQTDIGSARWIVVNGCRRLAAAQQYGCAELEFVIKDAVAASRATLLAVSIAENVDRQNFDVLEEARAVDALVTECGSAAAAAEQLKRSKGWVSQRRALLELAPELQDALRRGDLAVRVARSLARVPREEQVDRWLATNSPDADKPEQPPKVPAPASVPQVTKALKKFGAGPETLAAALTGYLDQGQLGELVAALNVMLVEQAIRTRTD